MKRRSAWLLMVSQISYDIRKRSPGRPRLLRLSGDRETSVMQKSNSEENIPLLPWFETVLLETPSESRRG
ncbi:hypothetical protein [Planctopirus hydrillae]|uniref:Uncharacterized protein n=1 Tax=Planctopirus hydrillae TaxID=1841610 RepID=A0A1C3ENT3_9PLAN|nr:hypothetical protein [Planctopirus hydrillae]ODA34901.1 hypothetical protein A6X21_04450 [Planctopirus hydrillae]